MTIMIQTHSTLVILIFLIWFNPIVEASDAEVSTIFKKTIQVYGDLSTYVDTGYVKTNIQEIYFNTHYVKPKLFSFNWESFIIKKNDKQIINRIALGKKAIISDGIKVWMSKERGGNRTIDIKPDLSSAISSETGTSLTSAHNIPSLLGLASGRNILDMERSTLVKKTFLDGKLCYYIIGHISDIHKIEIWIDCEQFIIRQIVSSNNQIKMKTKYLDVRINTAIKRQLFDLIE